VSKHSDGSKNALKSSTVSGSKNRKNKRYWIEKYSGKRI